MKPTSNTVKVAADEIKLAATAEEDEDFLNEVYFSTRYEEFSAVGWDEAQIRQFLAMQYGFQKQSYAMQFPGAENSIIHLDGERIGRMIVYRSAVEIRLVDISLLPEFRNAGIGTKLIDDLLSEAGERHLPLRLCVAVRNQSALRLYQKLGFRINGTNEFDYSMEWSVR